MTLTQAHYFYGHPTSERLQKIRLLTEYLLAKNQQNITSKALRLLAIFRDPDFVYIVQFVRLHFAKEMTSCKSIAVFLQSRSFYEYPAPFCLRHSFGVIWPV